MNALRSMLAALVIGCTLYAHNSNAVLVLTNGTSEIEWYVGDPEPSIDISPAHFGVIACGAELAWVYDNFPTVPKRTLNESSALNRRALATQVPPEIECVIWRGDHARFIADNILIGAAVLSQ